MLIDLTSKPAARELRLFAGLWFPAMCIVLGVAARRSGADGIAYTIWVTGVALGVSGLVRPAIIRPVYTGLIVLTFPIGWLMSHVLLLVMYFLVITPIGWLVRQFQDPMERSLDRQATSYWTPREASPPTRYFNQF